MNNSDITDQSTIDEELDFDLLDQILSELSSSVQTLSLADPTIMVSYEIKNQVDKEGSSQLHRYLSQVVQSQSWILNQQGLVDPIIICSTCRSMNCNHVFKSLNNEEDGSIHTSILWGTASLANYVQDHQAFLLKAGLSN